jgi:threonine dehydratase
MPNNALNIKKDAVAGYGAEITYCEPTLDARESNLNKILDSTGAIMIHPYNDERIIAGQGTAALELLEEYPKLEVVMTPIGGGGLMSGTCISAKGINSKIIVVGTEPKGADDAYQSLNKGEIVPQTDPQTMADGLLTSLGVKTFPIIKEHVQEIITVSEENIVKAMKLVWDELNIVIEPSSAVVLGALFEDPYTMKGKKVGMILSGGNADLENLPW